MNNPTWLSVDPDATSNLSSPSRPSMHSPQIMHKDDELSFESGCGNGFPILTAAPMADSMGIDRSVVKETDVNRGPTPLDFTSTISSSEDKQPINLSDQPHLPVPVTVSAAAAALLGALHPDAPEELRRKFPLASKPLLIHSALALPNTLSQTVELHLDDDGRDFGSKQSPQYSSGSYDSVKMELCAEDLTVGCHGPSHAEDDDDDHDDHDDGDKINDTEGVDPERLKAFNMFVRLFVDENLDRMVPISKQPKEKIQAIIESCSRQFPEFQERARKRIRTYLKSCRRMKKNGIETRPTPPHLTSAMAENILAAACESESRKAAKRMRLDIYHTQDEQLSILDRSNGRVCEPASLAHSAYSLAASTFSQDQLYINGGLNYSYRGYRGLGASVQLPVSLTTGNGPTDLSVKSVASNSPSSSSNSLGAHNGGVVVGGGGSSTHLSATEITAVRQLIAGYRESAAFLLRSADELENLILQQN